MLSKSWKVKKKLGELCVCWLAWPPVRECWTMGKASVIWSEGLPYVESSYNWWQIWLTPLMCCSISPSCGCRGRASVFPRISAAVGGGVEGGGATPGLPAGRALITPHCHPTPTPTPVSHPESSPPSPQHLGLNFEAVDPVSEVFTPRSRPLTYLQYLSSNGTD